ncbi:flagellar motor protein MotB [Aestuariibius sp. HNIBRBA575]|uniref:flagellar motor protein MotB n=1 Tax=Aestuariibius sp. HNIBRBA575 TaxID=3233343 RepID=UPI0034A2DA11
MSNEAPVIIKRKKVVGGDGHHGGAWKVAYADFVTAMMAFFMLMWLLNATTEQQRKGIADYFSPTIPINRISGGGDGAFGGSSVFSQDSLAENGTGGAGNFSGDTVRPGDSDVQADGGQTPAQVAALENVEQQLLGIGGESLVSDRAMRHVLTRLTDEGLIVEIFDLPGAPLFDGETNMPTETTVELVSMFARVLSMVENDLAIKGHTRSRALVVSENPVWELSTSRAQQIRMLLENAQFESTRIERVVGYADRKILTSNPTSPRNNRIEIVVLRSDQ